jgi:hypothetical protein
MAMATMGTAEREAALTPLHAVARASVTVRADKRYDIASFADSRSIPADASNRPMAFPARRRARASGICRIGRPTSRLG